MSGTAVLTLALALFSDPGGAGLAGSAGVEGDAASPRPESARLAGVNRDVARKMKPVGAVTLFVMDRCSLCTLMINFLNARGIPYVKHDIEKDRAAARLFRELGGRRVPLTRVGAAVIHGYDPDAVVRLLKVKQ